MTLVIPIVLSLGLGVFEFGNLYYKYHLIENAVRDAARYAALTGSIVCTDINIQNKVIDIAKKTGADSGLWPTNSDIRVNCTSFDNKAASYKYRGGDVINSVKVSASIDYTPLGFLAFFKLTAPKLRASHEERVIGG